MRNYRDHLINAGTSIKEALKQLNYLASDAILFVVDENSRLKGSLTDGDVRRGLIRDFDTGDRVEQIIQPHPKFITKSEYDVQDIMDFRKSNFKIIPVLDDDRKIVNIINLNRSKSYLPVDAVIMAGGRGSRLRPMTDTTPKPLLKVGDKPIIEHNLDCLLQYGVDDFWISVRYLGEQIEAFFGDGSRKSARIKYIWEGEAQGTIGAASKIEDFEHDDVLIANSDILTNIDYEDFFLDFQTSKAALSVVSIPYVVDVPYGVFETHSVEIRSLKEKPSYTYYANGGIYIMKREVLHLIPKDTFFNATDLVQRLLDRGDKVITYPLRGYWLDIGKPEDFKKAQQDIHHIKF